MQSRESPTAYTYFEHEARCQVVCNRAFTVLLSIMPLELTRYISRCDITLGIKYFVGIFWPL